MKVLVVDDNAEVRRLIKGLLAEIAEEIYECADGALAIDIYTRQHPDWVLMDVFMKETNGFAATKAIRKIDPQAKIVIITSYTDKRTRQAAAESGAAAFLGKDDLLALIPLLRGTPR